MADSSKTEQATPRRRQKAREQGQVARSRDLISGLAIGATVLITGAQAASFAGAWRELLRSSLDSASSEPSLRVNVTLTQPGYGMIRTVGPILALSWVVAIAGAFAQGGLVFSFSPLQPQLARLNPATRLEQLFSLSSIARLAKSLLPGTAIIYVTVGVISRDWAALLTLPHQPGRAVAGFAMSHCFEVAWKGALIMLLWSAADFALERHRLSGELRMSKQDIRDEYKETEGSPATRSRIRRIRRQLRRRRMLDDVKRAAVVITNPTEFAVALEYRMEMAAPVVVAKGRHLFAQQIKEIARWNRIPIVENPPLAQALYRAIEVGQAIPPKLYAVVAAILAAIYRAEERARQTTAENPGA